MAETIDLQSEQFMTLLTDALRAGPGSPEWSQAVKLLRASGGDVDEYTLLQSAREHLDAGKDYRSVKAGKGFTRKLMDGIDQEGKRAGPSSAGIIAIIAGLVIVAVLVIVGAMFFKGGSPTPEPKATDELQNTIFGNRLTAASFSAPTSDGWTKFGELPVVSGNGELHPTTQPTAGGAEVYKAGGWVVSDPIAADQPIEVDATVKLAKVDEGIVQVFVSDVPITDANAAGGHALVWQLKSGESRAFLPEGKVASPGEKLTGQKELAVRLRLNKEQAIIDAGDKRLYAAGNMLAGDKPRYVGVRFLRHGGEKWDHPAISSLVIQKP